MQGYMGKALRSVRRQRSEGKIWISAFIIVVVRIVRNVPYWAESETQMLGFVVEEFVVIYTYTYVSDGKESTCNAGDPGSSPGSGKSPGEGNGCYPLQYSCLENPMDREAWRAAVHSVAKSQT